MANNVKYTEKQVRKAIKLAIENDRHSIDVILRKAGVTPEQGISNENLLKFILQKMKQGNSYLVTELAKFLKEKGYLQAAASHSAEGDEAETETENEPITDDAEKEKFNPLLRHGVMIGGSFGLSYIAGMLLKAKNPFIYGLVGVGVFYGITFINDLKAAKKI